MDVKMKVFALQSFHEDYHQILDQSWNRKQLPTPSLRLPGRPRRIGVLPILVF
jgi:hypothetical protein